MSVTVTMNGPVVEGTAADELDSAVPRAIDKVADHGENLIRIQLGKVLKHPTGYYESRIQTDRQRDGNLITDGGVVYGPWLEGVSSRNKRSRFRGYRTFRLAAQELEADAPKIVEQFVADALGTG